MSVDRKESDQDPAVKARHRQTYRTGCSWRFATCRRSRRSARPSRAPMPTRTGAAAHASPAAGEVDYGVNNATDSYADAVEDPDRRGPMVLARGRRGDVDAGRGQPAPGAGDLRRRDRGRKDHPGGARSRRTLRTRTRSPASSASSAWSRTSARTASSSSPGTTCSIACGFDPPDPEASLPERIFDSPRDRARRPPSRKRS